MLPEVARSTLALENPYLAEYLASRSSGAGRGVIYGCESWDVRQRLVHRYAWAIPSEEAILAIAAIGPVTELCAGTGYWAWLLRQVGADVVAYDEAPPDRAKNCYHNTGGQQGGGFTGGTVPTWTEVLQGSASDVVVPPERALMLCWPPYKQPAASVALERYRGDVLVYVGEDGDGCTGDGDFHDALCLRWRAERDVEIPQWSGIHDVLTIYRRCEP